MRNQFIKAWIVNIIAAILIGSALHAEEYHVSSPDGQLEIQIDVNGAITFSVLYQKNEIIAPSPISLTLDNGTCLGKNAVIKKVQKRKVNNTFHPVVRLKSKEIKDTFSELQLQFKMKFNLTFRAYDNGAAYRFETNDKGDITVQSEEVTLNMVQENTVYFPQEESFMSHNECYYKKLALNQIKPGDFCSLPVLISTQKGIKILFTEADLEDFPGLWLKVNKDHAFTGIHPGVALEEEARNDRNVYVTQHADYIAETKGTRTFPWRVIAVADTDADLITNQLVYLLSKPLQLKDTSWIKPGKVAWDWWNFNNIYGVDFKAGVNTETYKYYIDFASKYGIEYIILDEGWYELGDCLKLSPDIDIEAILAHGREKNVGIILWVIWKTLDDQLEAALDQYEKWGVKGIKVDFMQRDDQWMVNYYHKIAREAAKRKLLVDFHGCYKPSGLRRAYPNVITREGLRGMEQLKWSDLATPEHNVTLPFIRMVPGPMDYTPGAMVNAQKRNFRALFSRPMSMGTRCHQLAMYVVYESPLQMLADNPSNYLRESECMTFISRVPTVWDETRVLHAKVAEYIAIARKHGDEWYVGAMTDELRELVIDFSFLDSGEYNIDIYQDGINAHRYASDYKMWTSTISKDQTMTIKLAPGGGWAAIIYKK